MKNYEFPDVRDVSQEKKQEPLPGEFAVCEEIREKLIENIDQDIRLLDNFDPEYSPEELEGITKKYNLIPRDNFKVVIEQLKNMKEKFEDNNFCIKALKDINFKFVLSERDPKEAEDYLTDGLISKAVQKH